MLVVLIVELLGHDLSKNVPFTHEKSLMRQVKFFLPNNIGVGESVAMKMLNSNSNKIEKT